MTMNKDQEELLQIQRALVEARTARQRIHEASQSLEEMHRILEGVFNQDCDSLEKYIEEQINLP